MEEPLLAPAPAPCPLSARRRLAVLAGHLGAADPLAEKDHKQRCERAAGSVFPDPYARSTPKGKIVVYGPPTSRVTKVLWAAAECGVHVEHVSAKLKVLKQQRWFYALNPKLTVPVMRDGPLVLNESNTIVAYLFQRYGPSTPSPSPSSSLAKSDAASVALAWQWLEYGESTVAAAQTPVWYGRTRNIRYSRRTSPADEDEIRHYVPKARQAWKAFDEHLARDDDRKYVLGKDFSMADITLAVQANRLRKCQGFGFAELELEANFPHVAGWLERIAQRPAFKSCVAPYGM